MRAPFLALALVLVMAAPAYAGSPDSNITTPGGTTFLMDDGNDTLLIAGHSTFSPIDIICTYGPDDQQVLSVNSSLAYHDIAQQSGTGGDFSATLPLEPLRYQDCVLRAIPAGTADDDPDLSTASGPTLSVGYRHADADPFNYDLQLAPLGGSAEFGQSSYYGGIQSTYALNPTDLSFVRLFSLSDSLVSSPDPDPGRQSVQVDGQDAYFQNDVSGFPHPGLDPSPPTFNFHSTDGTGGVSSHEPLGACVPGGAFPPSPSNCTNVVTDGVRLDHSADLIDNGALSLVDEQFTSTDGAAHMVDAWFRQSAYAGNAQWRFPGDPGFSDYMGVVGKTVPGGPATALLSTIGPAYGSLSWSEAPDAVRFQEPRLFSMHYRFTVPAGGSHVLHFAYGSSFTADGAAALGAEALAKWQPVVAPGGGGGGGGGGGSTPPPTGPAKLRARFAGVKSGGNGTVAVTLNAPGAGNLSASETAVVPRSAAKQRTRKLTVSSLRRKVGKAGKVKLVLKLNRKGRKLLRSKHRLPVTLSVTYKPTAGSGNKLTRHLTLRLRKQRRHPR